MRTLACRLVTLFAATLATPATCRAIDQTADAPPHAARVAIPGAAVRSGPADDCYLTDTLPEDATVDVYERRPDGWCAIQPPEGSFSWVYAEHVEPTGDALATINKDDVPARVGSRLSARRNEVQVRLEQGETVEILGQDRRDGKLWYKIAPPAGEFRWIHARDLAFHGPSGWEPAEITTVSLDEAAAPEAEGKSSDVVAPPLAIQPDKTWSAADNTKSINNAKLPATEITPIDPEQPATTSSAPAAEVAIELSQLELRLSRMVAEPTATWNVDSLEQAAERLLSQADSVAQRAAVKATLAKIDRFAAIHRRYVAALGKVPGPRVTAGEAPTGTRPPSVAGDGDGDAVDVPQTQFDAVGVLRPVVSRRPGAPQFALVDSQGQVVTFLTPTPDVNLRPYVGRRIGVVGSRGYIPEFHRGHVTAGRVTPLEGRRLR